MSESNDEPDDDHYYINNRKTKPGIACSRCGALHDNGSWTWNALPENIEHDVCPTCTRIDNNNPAGRVIIRGNYFSNHKDDIMQLIDTISKSELSDYPLERLMEMKNGSEETELTTTGIHLARRIGYALQLAYDGELSSKQSGDDHIIVYWTKND
ncbi:MAG: BCAM0308 family protein [Gracilimonas sp.]|nr:BCAM0308 family protein [Gracilimonas sp.]